MDVKNTKARNERAFRELAQVNLNIECLYKVFDFYVFYLILFLINYTLKYTVNRRYAEYAAYLLNAKEPLYESYAS